MRWRSRGSSSRATALQEQVQRRAELRDLLRDLGDLPAEQREALLLAELGDLSHADIADVLDCEVDRVKALVFRARSGLIQRRDARDMPCLDVQAQLANLRGGSLRRGEIKHHLRVCEGCREFRAEVRRQRRLMAAILPVVPSTGLKAGVLGGLGMGGGSAGGGAAMAGGSSLAAKLAVAGVLAGGGALVGTAAIDNGEATPKRAQPAVPPLVAGDDRPAAAAPEGRAAGREPGKRGTTGKRQRGERRRVEAVARRERAASPTKDRLTPVTAPVRRGAGHGRGGEAKKPKKPKKPKKVKSPPPRGTPPARPPKAKGPPAVAPPSGRQETPKEKEPKEKDEQDEQDGCRRAGYSPA